MFRLLRIILAFHLSNCTLPIAERRISDFGLRKTVGSRPQSSKQLKRTFCLAALCLLLSVFHSEIRNPHSAIEWRAWHVLPCPPLARILFRSYSIKDVSNEAATISLRPTEAEDEQFLYQVYASTRAEEMAQWGWDERQQELFLKMQFRARDQAYPIYYQGLDDRIILCGNELAGRMIVNRSPEEIRLVDISLLPRYRNAGIGTSLIKALFAEADETKSVVRLQVEKANGQAHSLYERLGFSRTGENQTHFQMERKAMMKAE
jgi:ribosomal protein S18 acetylase RimI-like enzyme